MGSFVVGVEDFQSDGARIRVSPVAFPPSFELTRLFSTAGGDGSEGLVLKDVDSGDGSGTSVSGAGDINGDGIGASTSSSSLRR